MSPVDRVDGATRWVLARAFLPVELPVEPPEDVTRVRQEAQRFRLAPRIAARCGCERLARELGAAAADWFVSASRQAAAQALRTEGLVRHLAAVAREHDLRFTVLKGGALHLRRIVPLSARPLYDLDILTSSSAARRLDDVLRRQGWERTTSRRMDYHLAPLRHPAWPLLDIHDYLPWVALDGRTWSTFPGTSWRCAMESRGRPGPTRHSRPAAGARSLSSCCNRQAGRRRLETGPDETVSLAPVPPGDRRQPVVTLR